MVIISETKVAFDPAKEQKEYLKFQEDHKDWEMKTSSVAIVFSKKEIDPAIIHGSEYIKGFHDGKSIANEVWNESIDKAINEIATIKDRKGASDDVQEAIIDALHILEYYKTEAIT